MAYFKSHEKKYWESSKLTDSKINPSRENHAHFIFCKPFHKNHPREYFETTLWFIQITTSVVEKSWILSVACHLGTTVCAIIFPLKECNLTWIWHTFLSRESESGGELGQILPTSIYLVLERSSSGAELIVWCILKCFICYSFSSKITTYFECVKRSGHQSALQTTFIKASLGDRIPFNAARCFFAWIISFMDMPLIFSAMWSHHFTSTPNAEVFERFFFSSTISIWTFKACRRGAATFNRSMIFHAVSYDQGSKRATLQPWLIISAQNSDLSCSSRWEPTSGMTWPQKVVVRITFANPPEPHSCSNIFKFLKGVPRILASAIL